MKLLIDAAAGLVIPLLAISCIAIAADPPFALAPAAAKPAPMLAEHAPLLAEQTLADKIITAARLGNAANIERLILQSFDERGALDESAVSRILDGLVRDRELAPFTALLDEMRKTNYAKDWQPDDDLLADLVRTGRTDFLDVLLARRLSLDRLAPQAKEAAPDTAAWITRRVEEVRKARADVDALVVASAKGEIDTMRGLLEAGVPVDGVSSDHWTPLTRAANKSQPAAVRLLLERGAEVDKPRHPGWDYTALCLTRSVEVAELLKAAGANVHAKLFRRDVSILTYICRWGGADMVEWMLKQGLDPKMIGDNKENLLFDAGDERTAEMLLTAGVDPNQADDSGRTPLLGAMSGKVALRLIEGGARVGGSDSVVIEMVRGFASADAIELVIKFLGKIAPARAQAAMMEAVQRDQADVVKVLLQHGADANKAVARGGREMLPLMTCAVYEGHVKTAKVLLENGADPNGGERPGAILQAAVKHGHVEVAKLLREAGARGITDLAFSIGIKDEAEINRLLRSAPSFAENPEFWSTALPLAARTGQLHAVRVALEKGVPIQPGGGEDALGAAASEGQHEVLAELLAHRPTPANPTDLRQALLSAVSHSRPYEKQRPAADFERCVKLLLDAGAPVTDADGRNNLMNTAVFTLRPGGNSKVMEMLVAAGADPNPLSDDVVTSHLSDAIQDMYNQNGESSLLIRTLETLERLARVTIKRGPAK